MKTSLKSFAEYTLLLLAFTLGYYLRINMQDKSDKETVGVVLMWAFVVYAACKFFNSLILYKLKCKNE